MVKALISQREVVNQYGGISDSLEKEYVDFFAGLGITVFPISNYGNVNEILSLDWDLIILTGGGILPQQYYNYDRTGARQEYRDAIEEMLIKAGLEKNIPLLGICRGMQMINAFLGGRTSSFENCVVERRVKESHPVAIDGHEYLVNNYHNDGLMVKDLGVGLEVIALDLDNKTVEAYSDGRGKILGIQWHPEREGNCPEIQEWVTREIQKMLKVSED